MLHNPKIIDDISFTNPDFGFKLKGQLAMDKSHSNSRYQTDFVEIKRLGKGGFGEVVQVKNNLDGRFYAIKKIKLKKGQDLGRIMREVKTLSRMQHRHVLRYYQA